MLTDGRAVGLISMSSMTPVSFIGTLNPPSPRAKDSGGAMPDAALASYFAGSRGIFASGRGSRCVQSVARFVARNRRRSPFPSLARAAGRDLTRVGEDEYPHQSTSEGAALRAAPR